MSAGSTSYDALVIGAGPAGTAAATVLAKHGRRVAIVEKERLPRYRVGESMIPHCWFPLERRCCHRSLRGPLEALRHDGPRSSRHYGPKQH